MLLVPSSQQETNVETPVGGAPSHLGGSLSTPASMTGCRPPEPVVGRAMVGPWFWAAAGKGSKTRFTCRNCSAVGRKVFSVGSADGGINKATRFIIIIIMSLEVDSYYRVITVVCSI